MKTRVVFSGLLFVFFVFACEERNEKPVTIQGKAEKAVTLDTIQSLLRNTYKPGFGKLMGEIQTQHAKLWFAGRNKNWKLADFELREMEETLENIEKYQATRKETSLLSVMDDPLDSVRMAIEKRDKSRFKEHFKSLTRTCNICHTNTLHGFIRIAVPQINPYRNQIFSPE